MTLPTQTSIAPPEKRPRAGYKRAGPMQKLSYITRWAPRFFWQKFGPRQPPEPVHLIFSLADHFEPAIVPEDGSARSSYDEQERRLERWCREYPKRFAEHRDAEGRSF